MRSIKLFSIALGVAGLVSTPTVAHAQGSVIASNDGWFTNTFGSTGPDGRLWLQNAVDWFGLFVGHDYVAVFVPSNMNVSLLPEYANGGGNAPIVASTGSMGSGAVEVSRANAFLSSFGRGYAPIFLGIAGNVPTSASPGHGVYDAALSHGVNSIFVNKRNDVVFSAPARGVTSGALSIGDHGLDAIGHVTATPEPASLALMATGLLGLIPVIRRRRQR